MILSLNKFINYKLKPDIILTHGDTASTFAASFVGFLNKIDVHHIEAGLRSNNLLSPWPEELNRIFCDTVSSTLYVPLKKNLLNLKMHPYTKKKIILTGNTVIDSLKFIEKKLSRNKKFKLNLEKKFNFLNPKKKIILFTCHRRENIGKNMKKIFRSLKLVVKKFECQIVYPVHPNREIHEIIKSIGLDSNEDIFLINPLTYSDFIYLTKKSNLIITDSGGIQEEAPSLGKYCIITRDTTERTESLQKKYSALVGNSQEKLLKEVKINLSKTMKKMNIYGNGNAYKIIMKNLQRVNF